MNYSPNFLRSGLQLCGYEYYYWNNTLLVSFVPRPVLATKLVPDTRPAAFLQSLGEVAPMISEFKWEKVKELVKKKKIFFVF